jgi:hypothetical protein
VPARRRTPPWPARPRASCAARTLCRLPSRC